jgi:Mce-associated membrane protein
MNIAHTQRPASTSDAVPPEPESSTDKQLNYPQGRSLTAGELAALAAAADAEAEAEEANAAAARERALRLQHQAEAVGAAPHAGDSGAADPSGHPTVGGSAPVAEVIDTDRGPETAASGNATSDDLVASDTKGRWWRLRGLLRPRLAIVAATVVVICALLGASGYVTWQHRIVVMERQRSAEFAAAARQSFLTLTSMDFNHAKQDVQRVLDNSTGKFKSDFQSQADDFTKTVEQSKVVTTGTVTAAAVESMTKDFAVVLVTATSQVTNIAGARQQPRPFRVSVTVTRDAGQIKMSKVEFFP